MPFSESMAVPLGLSGVWYVSGRLPLTKCCVMEMPMSNFITYAPPPVDHGRVEPCRTRFCGVIDVRQDAVAAVLGRAVALVWQAAEAGVHNLVGNHAMRGFLRPFVSACLQRARAPWCGSREGHPCETQRVER